MTATRVAKVPAEPPFFVWCDTRVQRSFQYGEDGIVWIGARCIAPSVTCNEVHAEIIGAGRDGAIAVCMVGEPPPASAMPADRINDW